MTRRYLLPLIAAALTPSVVTQRALSQGPPAVLVAVSPVVEREVVGSQTSVGTVMPLMKSIVGSTVDGRVIEFPLNEGDRVEQGQTLAQLLTETIELEVAVAEAELELRRQQLAELQNGSRPEEIAQMKARMVAAQARVQYANARRARAENLFRQGQAMTQEERDEIVALAVEAEQAYLDAKAAYELTVAGPRKEQIAQAAAQVAMQQATVNRLKDQLAKHTVVSRFSGYVTAEHTEVGQWLKQGDPVAEVAALDEVEVMVHVVEQYVPHIRVGMEVSVQIPAIAGEPLTGVVSAIVPQADVQARTFPVKVRVKNRVADDGPLVKSGMYARVMLPTGQKQLAMLVSKDALVLGGAEPVIFIVNLASADAKQGKVQSVPVQLGLSEGSMIQVRGALQAGQLVAVQGNERLFPGQDVKIQRVIPAADADNRSALNARQIP
ncbi:MAG TPA: efflux RND transporter periplasmic adaptor subunit [Lacipirellulaceae bacterium]|jgi:RND family efflux transporter MFP subunit|nr:efflux RND transporter periplasmic adaptor subunit [Lacipirellulaceae bacterium]